MVSIDRFQLAIIEVACLYSGLYRQVSAGCNREVACLYNGLYRQVSAGYKPILYNGLYRQNREDFRNVTLQTNTSTQSSPTKQ